MKGAAVVAVLVLFLLVIIGWVMNIVLLVKATGFGTLELVRLVGIFLAPVGSLMGWLF